jgi:Ca-activated chloride channel family protein
VLITDGENNAGMTKEAFLAAYKTLPAPTFVIRLDTTDPVEVTSLTGVTTVDAKTASLLEAVKQIRGCR